MVTGPGKTERASRKMKDSDMVSPHEIMGKKLKHLSYIKDIIGLVHNYSLSIQVMWNGQHVLQNNCMGIKGV